MLLRKNKDGFTIGELLLTVAIVVILAAIALPMISNIQKNMKLTELDSAAHQIANAAQNQMTGMKVSGGWMGMLDDPAKSDTYKNQKAKGIPSGLDQGDLYYLTATQARENNVLPWGAVEEAVWRSDFIIEYSRSTATVNAVFYADGRGSVFNNAPATTHAAENYYKAMTSPSQRERTARADANPPIGYFAGKLAGATNTVALSNPLIFVSGAGQLCIENKNLAGENPWETTSVLSFTFTNVTEGKDPVDISVKKIEGPEGDNPSFYTVSSTRAAEELQLNNDDMAFFGLTSRNTEATSDEDVFSFNLDVLMNILADSGDPDFADLATKFGLGDQLQVDAQIVTAEGERKCEPARATAFIQWPEPTSVIGVYVTNPHLDNTAPAPHITGTYTSPETKLLADTLDPPVTGIALTPDKKRYGITTTPQQLISENGESAAQNYSGGYVDLKEAAAQKTYVRTTVGSYTSSNTHAYQINEIWINRTLVGYLQNNAWVWSGPAGAQFATAVSGIAAGQNTDGVTTFLIDVRVFENAMGSTNVADGNGAYAIYVRTAPRLSEVQGFYDYHADVTGNVFNSWSSVNSDTNARDSGGALARRAFEGEFGASSAVASWTIAQRQGSDVASGVRDYPDDPSSARVYYAMTPALGFGGSLTEGTGSELRNAALWHYPRNGTTYPRAMVREARDGNSLHMGQRGTADFSIPISRDELFYRVLRYYLEDGVTPAGKPLQYIPYSVQNTDGYAETATKLADKLVDEGGKQVKYICVGWETNDTYNHGSNPLRVAGSTKIGTYDANLAYGAVDLRAKYVRAGVGIMYLEFGSDGAMTGYSGYVYNEQRNESLPSNNSLVDWGYYALVSAENDPDYYPIVTAGGHTLSLGETKTVTIGGNNYRAYRLVYTAAQEGDLLGNPSYSGTAFTNDGPQYSCRLNGVNDPDEHWEYYVGIFFGASVTQSKATMSGWGDKATPFQVRAADQMRCYLRFIGPSANNRRVKELRLQGSYQLQTHDVDMGVITATGKRADAGFSLGGYNGNNFHIKNYKLNKGGDQAPNNVGLWPSANGVTFENIYITDLVDSHLVDPKMGSPNEMPKEQNATGIGILVGAMGDSTVYPQVFSNCHIIGGGSSGGRTQLTVNVPGGLLGAIQPGPTYGNLWLGCSAGGFVGSTTGSNQMRGSLFTNCSVENVDMAVNVINVNGQAAGLYVGGFAGATRNSGFLSDTVTTPANVTASNSSMTVSIAGNISNVGTTVQMGGVIGHYEYQKYFVDNNLLPSASRNVHATNIGLYQDTVNLPPASYNGAAFGYVHNNGVAPLNASGIAINVTYNGTPPANDVGRREP